MWNWIKRNLTNNFTHRYLQAYNSGSFQQAQSYLLLQQPVFDAPYDGVFYINKSIQNVRFMWVTMKSLIFFFLYLMKERKKRERLRNNKLANFTIINFYFITYTTTSNIYRNLNSIKFASHDFKVKEMTEKKRWEI